VFWISSKFPFFFFILTFQDPLIPHVIVDWVQTKKMCSIINWQVPRANSRIIKNASSNLSLQSSSLSPPMLFESTRLFESYYALWGSLKPFWHTYSHLKLHFEKCCVFFSYCSIFSVYPLFNWVAIKPHETNNYRAMSIPKNYCNPLFFETYIK